MNSSTTNIITESTQSLQAGLFSNYKLASADDNTSLETRPRLLIGSKLSNVYCISLIFDISRFFFSPFSFFTSPFQYHVFFYLGPTNNW